MMGMTAPGVFSALGGDGVEPATAMRVLLAGGGGAAM